MNLAGFVHYQCRSCKRCALNHHTDSCTRYRECQRCHAVWVLDQGEPVDQLLADLRWAAHAVLVESSILDSFEAGEFEEEPGLSDCTNEDRLAARQFEPVGGSA